MLRRGQPFTCRGCGAKLAVPKAATSLAIAAFALLALLSKRIPVWLVAVLIAAALVIEWLLAKVQLVAEGVPAD